MMAYKKGLAVCLKVNGKIIREQNDLIVLPFGSEYQIGLKNLSTQRALINIEIDGISVTGNGLIISGNESCDLERFIGGQFDGKRFKFIKKTQNISNYRGDRIDDGIIRITYQFEKQVFIRTPYIEHHYDYFNYPFYGCPKDLNLGTPKWTSGSNINYVQSDFSCMDSLGSVTTCSSNLRSFYTPPSFEPKIDNGITVGGNDSNQEFNTGYISNLESEKHVIIYHLQGTNDKPIFVKSKIQCPICGKSNKSFNKFCVECGTNLK